LGIVLVLSFIKQVFNYLFVATEKQNVLFVNNLIGVTVGILIALFVIPRWNLLGGIITQITIELMFTGGAMLIAWKHKLLPLIQKKTFWTLLGILVVAGGIGFGINRYLQGQENSLILFFGLAFIFNGLILLAAFKPIKTVAKGLTID